MVRVGALGREKKSAELTPVGVSSFARADLGRRAVCPGSDGFRPSMRAKRWNRQMVDCRWSMVEAASLRSSMIRATARCGALDPRADGRRRTTGRACAGRSAKSRGSDRCSGPGTRQLSFEPRQTDRFARAHQSYWAWDRDGTGFLRVEEDSYAALNARGRPCGRSEAGSLGLDSPPQSALRI